MSLVARNTTPGTFSVGCHIPSHCTLTVLFPPLRPRLGPDRYYSPLYRIPRCSLNEGSNMRVDDLAGKVARGPVRIDRRVWDCRLTTELRVQMRWTPWRAISTRPYPLQSFTKRPTPPLYWLSITMWSIFSPQPRCGAGMRFVKSISFTFL